MNIKYTGKTLKKLEQIIEDGKYILRYEKGHFNSGYCILEDKKIVVVKKFLELEGKINTLLDIIPGLEIEVGDVQEDLQDFYTQIVSEEVV